MNGCGEGEKVAGSSIALVKCAQQTIEFVRHHQKLTFRELLNSNLKLPTSLRPHAGTLLRREWFDARIRATPQNPVGASI